MSTIWGAYQNTPFPGPFYARESLTVFDGESGILSGI
jgi:hypothetical protein